jgi:hypothetical protein
LSGTKNNEALVAGLSKQKPRPSIKRRVTNYGSLTQRPTRELAVTRHDYYPVSTLVDLVVNGDNRGWFKENYQKEKLEALGLPSFDRGSKQLLF